MPPIGKEERPRTSPRADSSHDLFSLLSVTGCRMLHRERTIHRLEQAQSGVWPESDPSEVMTRVIGLI